MGLSWHVEQHVQCRWVNSRNSALVKADPLSVTNIAGKLFVAKTVLSLCIAASEVAYFIGVPPSTWNAHPLKLGISDSQMVLQTQHAPGPRDIQANRRGTEVLWPVPSDSPDTMHSLWLWLATLNPCQTTKHNGGLDPRHKTYQDEWYVKSRKLWFGPTVAWWHGLHAIHNCSQCLAHLYIDCTAGIPPPAGKKANPVTCTCTFWPWRRPGHCLFTSWVALLTMDQHLGTGTEELCFLVQGCCREQLVMDEGVNIRLLLSWSVWNRIVIGR